MSRAVSSLVWSLVILALLFGGVWTYSALTHVHVYAGTTISEPKPLPDFSLANTRGTVTTARDLVGKPTLMFFGYTHCPDYCPNTLSHIKQVLDELPESQREKVQVVFVSLDPERDTPEVLARYLEFFNPRYLGLTGAPEETESLVKSLGVYYQKSGEFEGGYFVDHTTATYLFDRTGNLVALYDYSQIAEAESVALDLIYLL